MSPAPPRWKRSPSELVALFEAVFPDDTRAERRQMFGYPAGFVNGNLFTGLHQDDFMVRLGEDDRAALLDAGGRPFEPMPGRAMHGYAVVPTALHRDRRRLAVWVARAFEHALTLPRKGKRAVKPRAGSKPRARKK